MESECLYGQVTLIYDHASQHSAYFLPKSGDWIICAQNNIDYIDRRNGSIFEKIFFRVPIYYLPVAKTSILLLLMIGLSVVFSGPGRTADDVISRDSSWIMR